MALGGAGLRARLAADGLSDDHAPVDQLLT
jgi:hypothetical protein